MNLIIRTLLESTIVLTIFYALYLIFFSSDRNFKFSRLYLITTSFFAILLPQLNIPILPSTNVDTFNPVYFHQAVQLPEIIITDPGGLSPRSIFNVSIYHLLLFGYLTGFLIFLTRFLWQIGYLLHFIYRNQSRIESRSFYKLIRTGGKLATCSFFNYLFWDDTLKLNDYEKEKILKHEEGHIKQKHSWDILYLELLGILLWFNPLIHSYRKSLSNIHEYLADQYALKNRTDPNYLLLLVKQVIQPNSLALSHHFSKSITLKRIKMIKSGKQYPGIFRWSLSLLITGLMFYFFACDSTGNFEYTQNADARFPDIPEAEIIMPDQIPLNDYKSSVENWINTNQNETFVVFSSERPEETLNLLYNVKNWKIISYHMDDSENSPTLYAVAHYIPGYQFSSNIESTQITGKANNASLFEDEEILTGVEQQPVPQNGMEEFFKYVQNNLKYPADAREEGIEGKVFIEFIVTRLGKVEEAKVLKGFHPSCDKVAREIVENSPAWKPGYQDGKAVNVRLILPITFKLN